MGRSGKFSWNLDLISPLGEIGETGDKWEGSMSLGRDMTSKALVPLPSSIKLGKAGDLEDRGLRWLKATSLRCTSRRESGTGDLGRVEMERLLSRMAARLVATGRSKSCGEDWSENSELARAGSWCCSASRTSRRRIRMSSSTRARSVWRASSRARISVRSSVAFMWMRPFMV